jgi:putative ABC transport system permease protein
MALGVWTYATMNSALLEVEKGKDNYYEEQRLGDAFASVTQIPKTALSGLEAIEGIKQVDGRIVGTFRVLMPDNRTDVIRLKGISTVVGENDERLNAYVHEGNDLREMNDILVGHDFYEAYGYKPGDLITLVMNQAEHSFTVQGSIYSPEYVYIVENVNELFSDTTKYNIAYFDEEMMMSVLGMEGVYNDLSFMFEEGVVYEDVKDQLRDALEKYGLIELYEKDDLFSYLMMEEEISGGRSMSTTLPMTFIAMAAVVLYLMLKRIIEQDRTQIGTLKAFGYSNTTILFHYIFYGFVTGSLGMLVGVNISLLTIGPYIQFYLDYYKVPMENVVTDYVYYYVGGVMSVIGGIIGAYFGARKMVHLKPVDAMRPPRLILNSRGFMAVRNISRNKIRSSFVVVGIMFSYSMMAMIGMMNTMMDSMFFNQFTHVMKYDASIVLEEQVDYASGIQSAMRIDGIDYAEGILDIPVLLKNGYKQTGTKLIGIREENYLYKAYDDFREINLPIKGDGIILGSILASSLDVEVGDMIYLSSPEFREDIKIPIYDIVNQNIGSSAFIDLKLLSDLMEQDEKINTLIFETESMDTIRETLLYSDQIQKIEDKAKTLELYESMLGSYDFLLVIMQIVAITIGFTIIYNTAVISMSERSREYATLRVLGLHVKEVKEIMSFEYWLLCFVGIILGIPFTRLLNYGLVNSIDVDAFSWPANVSTEAYIIGAIGCIIAVAIANLTSVKAIKKLDLVEVLKERE